MPAFPDPEIYRTILEGLKTGICVVDRQRKILLWNDGAERITGYLRHEAVGHSCGDNILLHCDQKKCELCGDRCPLTAAFHDAKPVEAVGSLHHKSGHRTPVHGWIIPIRDEHGSIIAAAHSFDGQRVVPVPDRRDTDLAAYGCLDVLTGVANHAMMQSHLRETLGTFAELHVPFCIVCVQVDDLALFRASYGKEAATSLLRVVAQTLENTLRPTDFAGRWSEDQFLGILIGCTDAALSDVCQRIRRMMTNGGIQWWGEELSPAVSIGHTAAQAGDTTESLVQRAQQSLKENVARQRARCCRWTKSGRT